MSKPLSDPLEILRDYLKPENDPRRRIAERLCELSSARLACAKCGYYQTLTIEKTLTYLSVGWPTCPAGCGEEMQILTGPKP